MASKRDDEHVEKLPKSSYHDDGACVCRHESHRKAGCHYDRNGFQETVSARAALYSSPTRFDASEADEVTQKTRMIGPKDSPSRRAVTSPSYQTAARRAGGESLWNVGAKADGVHENFKPRSMGGVGFHYPYFHEWHHLIANAMLVKHLLLRGKPEPYLLLEVLMAGKYNLNHARNIVLLPQQKRVGDIVKWPIHPNNHGKFDEYAQELLRKIKGRLEKALAETGHPVRNKTTEDIAESVYKISDRLLTILDAVGKEKGGVHLNRVRKLYEELQGQGAS